MRILVALRLGWVFVSFLLFPSVVAFAAELSPANRLHLQRLRLMETNLARDPSKAAALAKIRGEIARIRQEFQLGEDDQPLQPRDKHATPPGTRRYQPEDFSRPSERSLVYGEAIRFATDPVEQGGMGLRGREATAWAEREARAGMIAFRQFVERFRMAAKFARARHEAGGPYMGDAEAVRWAEESARRRDAGALRGYIERFKAASAFARASLEEGGLGMGNTRAAAWSLDTAEKASLAEIQDYVRKHKAAQAVPREPRSNLHLKSCDAIYKRFFEF